MKRFICWENVHQDSCQECAAGLVHVIARVIPVSKNVVRVSDGTLELVVGPSKRSLERLAQLHHTSAERRLEQ